MVAATAQPVHAAANRRLYQSPHLVPVLECVLTDRLATAELVARHAEVAAEAAALAARCTPSPCRQAKTPFHALRVPSVTPLDYLHRLVRHSHCSRAAFITALMYLDRAAARRPELHLTPLNVHRLLLTAVLLATKYLDDILYDNAHFAFVGGLDVAELNILELTLLKVLNWRLHVPAADFRDYETRLVHAVMASPNSQFNDLRCSLLALVTDKDAVRPSRKMLGLPPSSPVSVSEGSADSKVSSK